MLDYKKYQLKERYARKHAYLVLREDAYLIDISPPRPAPPGNMAATTIYNCKKPVNNLINQPHYRAECPRQLFTFQLLTQLEPGIFWMPSISASSRAFFPLNLFHINLRWFCAENATFLSRKKVTPEKRGNGFIALFLRVPSYIKHVN